MSLTQVRKYLATLDKAQLVDLFADLYRNDKATKEYLDYMANPDEQRRLEQAYTAIAAEFSPRRRRRRLATPRFSVARREITAFRKLAPSDQNTLNLMLATLTLATQYGMQYYITEAYATSIAKMYRDTLLFAQQTHLINDNLRILQDLYNDAKYFDRYTYPGLSYHLTSTSITPETLHIITT